MNKAPIPKATLGRLPNYLHYLKKLPEETEYISATALAKHLLLGEVQVRKDLAAVSGKGRPKTGYAVADLTAAIEGYLGSEKLTSAVIVGAGRLGRALLEYDGFENFGVKIVAAFDTNASSAAPESSKKILPTEDFEGFCKLHMVQIGIITVGEESAQSVCDKMLEVGITAIWNFAPCKLKVPNGVLIKEEDLALSLAYLGAELINKEAESKIGKAADNKSNLILRKAENQK